MTDLNTLMAIDDDVEETKDVVGGGGGYIKDSGVYMVKVQHAFIEMSKGGATGVNISMKHTKENGESEFNTTEYVKSGNAKGNLNYYVSKAGNKVLLPGYVTVDEMCLAATGKPLRESTTSTKSVEVYDFEARAKKSKEVEVIDALTGAILMVGIDKVLVNKFANGAPIAEETERNQISKAFDKTGRTSKEAAANAAPEFIEKWKEKHEGVVKDDRTIKGTPASAHAAAAPTESADDTEGLFD